MSELAAYSLAHGGNPYLGLLLLGMGFGVLIGAVINGIEGESSSHEK